MFDFLEFLSFMALVFFALGIFLGAMFGLGIKLDKAECAAYNKATSIETKYEFPAGCFMKVDDTWLSWDEYKYRQVGAEAVENE